MLKVKYPGQPKNVNDLWDEYSEEKYHIEFKQTQWKNLEEFIEYLKGNKNLGITGNFPACRITYLISKTSQFISEQKKKRQELVK